jgi:F-type H+-transporting ATPase subunit b
MSPSVATFLFESVNFLLLVVVLSWAFFRPVQRAIDARRDALAAERRAAERAREDAQRLLADAEKRSREIEGSLEPLREALRRNAESEAARLIADASREAEEERSALRAELERMRQVQACAVARDAAAAARTLVEMLLAEIDGPDLDLALARAAARRLGTLPPSATNGQVLVESARPLADEALRVICDALGRASADRRLRVDPALIAGVRITTSCGLIDASASGMAHFAERELAARIEPEEGDHG